MPGIIGFWLFSPPNWLLHDWGADANIHVRALSRAPHVGSELVSMDARRSSRPRRPVFGASLAVPRVRADYDQLGQVAQRFGVAAEAAGATLQTIQQNMQVLEGGDWVGQGAKAFYQEMSGSVLPTLKRLTSALQAAQQIPLTY